LLELKSIGKTGVYKSTGKTFNKACSPFVTKLANILIDVSKRNPEIENSMKSN